MNLALFDNFPEKHAGVKVTNISLQLCKSLDQGLNLSVSSKDAPQDWSVCGSYWTEELSIINSFPKLS